MANSRGRAPSTQPNSVNARDLDPDRPLWERQLDETDDAFAAFQAWLLSDKRRVGDHGPTAHKWSAAWSWGTRAFAWDNYMIGEEARLQVRLRVDMNDRQRRIARAAQSKIVQWLSVVDATKLSTSDAIRLLEVSTRLEQAANGGTSPGVVAELDGPDDGDDTVHEGTLEERLAASAGDLAIDLRDLAKHLHQKMPRSS